MGAWVMGYLTGVNTASTHRGDPDFLLRTNIDGPAAWAWIDNYCRANPLDNLFNASQALELELKQRAIQGR
jgi:hypothetical protein